MYMEELKKMIRRLRIQYLLFWFLAILLCCVYEFGFFEEGVFAGDSFTEYVLQSLGILLTLLLVPFALKMFRLAIVKRVTNLPFDQAIRSHRLWSEIRMALFAVVIFVNLSIYYCTLSTIGLLCASIGALASFFCWPSFEQIKNELDL